MAMARIAAIFPNEGSQYVGMGKEFYAKSITARDFFEKAEKLLERKIAKICFYRAPRKNRTNWPTPT